MSKAIKPVKAWALVNMETGAIAWADILRTRSIMRTFARNFPSYRTTQIEIRAIAPKKKVKK
jgi:hypothetical protein